MNILQPSDPYRVIRAAPLVFGLHVAEEPPNFVKWFNSLVVDNISQQSLLAVKGAAFAITLIVTALAASTRENASIFLALAGLSFLMFANGLFHLTATIVHGIYSPGAITSALLYLPYFVWFVWSVIKAKKFSAASIAATILMGSF
ncbi:MAG: HXXEE domain-containing protein, partial [candidate division KSB1 bacterium]|nr:HXXEE domain-containing protein [candidate division KSB1 bacterium]